ncbi:MAG: dihydroneopterin aldolase, partial [Tardiphaga sp.]
MSDMIFIKGVSVHAHHGVLDYEGVVGQRFVLDLELTADIALAARSDRLADT